MKKYLNTPIKEIITNFPQVGNILEAYNIGCVPCTLGSCLLKDIVSIHNLPKDQESELMYRIEKVLYPDRDVKKPIIGNLLQKEAPRELKYSPPIKRLVDEHVLIKQLLTLMPKVIANIDMESDFDRQIILDSLDFIRFYADKFHHAKEEDILFEYTDKNLDIIKTMLADHETARAHVRAVFAALKTQDKKSIIENLNAYCALLAEHIKKEDEILYPWIDRGLTTKQVGELFARFNEAEEKMNMEVIEKCKRFIAELAQKVTKLKGRE
ncbi:hemerythrin domain-containing protein [Candidatus Saganbacteria bacterium]|nr:hemerythrin domain-containing protein [Candidatus Saganbacteria bacterium]